MRITNNYTIEFILTWICCCLFLLTTHLTAHQYHFLTQVYLNGTNIGDILHLTYTHWYNPQVYHQINNNLPHLSQPIFPKPYYHHQTWITPLPAQLHIQVWALYHIPIKPDSVLTQLIIQAYFSIPSTDTCGQDVIVSLPSKNMQHTIIARYFHDTNPLQSLYNFFVDSHTNYHMFNNKHLFLSLST